MGARSQTWSSPPPHLLRDLNSVHLKWKPRQQVSAAFLVGSGTLLNSWSSQRAATLETTGRCGA